MIHGDRFAQELNELLERARRARVEPVLPRLIGALVARCDHKKVADALVDVEVALSLCAEHQADARRRELETALFWTPINSTPPDPGM